MPPFHAAPLRSLIEYQRRRQWQLALGWRIALLRHHGTGRRATASARRWPHWVMDSGAAFELYDTNKAAAFVIHSATPLWADNLWNDYMPGWRWAKAWQVWHDTAGAEGEEPAAFVQRIYELAEGRIGALPGSDEDKALYAEIRQIHYDNLIFLNVAEQVRYALVTNADLGNVPHAGQAIGGNNSGEQFFYRTPQ